MRKRRKNDHRFQRREYERETKERPSFSKKGVREGEGRTCIWDKRVQHGVKRERGVV